MEMDEIAIVGARWLVNMEYVTTGTFYMPNIYPECNRMLVEGILRKLFHNLGGNMEEEHFVTLHELDSNGTLRLLSSTKID